MSLKKRDRVILRFLQDGAGRFQKSETELASTLREFRKSDCESRASACSSISARWRSTPASKAAVGKSPGSGGGWRNIHRSPPFFDRRRCPESNKSDDLADKTLAPGPDPQTPSKIS